LIGTGVASSHAALRRKIDAGSTGGTSKIGPSPTRPIAVNACSGAPSGKLSRG